MHVAVLAGSCSSEHDVSLRSASQVLEHIDRERHTVWPVLIDRDGQWCPARRPLAPSDVWSFEEPSARHAPLRPGTGLDWLLDRAGVEVIFPVLHGPFGEDGTVQGMLEVTGVPFVGSGCAASAVAMDKLRARQAYVAEGIPVAPIYRSAKPWRNLDAKAEFAAMNEAIGTPAFAKVDASGSTFGVHRIFTEAELATFLSEHEGRFRRWFAEQGVQGDEITVAVLGNTGRSLQALPPVGIYPVADDWFTTDAKYTPGATEEIVPPRGMSEQTIREVQQLAMRCHELLVCDGMSRTDMIMSKDGPIVLETNTIPGLTAESLLPRAAKAAGYSFTALLDRLLDLAKEQHGIVSSAPRVRRRSADAGAAEAQ